MVVVEQTKSVGKEDGANNMGLADMLSASIRVGSDTATVPKSMNFDLDLKVKNIVL